MNETELIKKITSVLNDQTDQLGTSVTQRLFEARRSAVRVAAARQETHSVGAWGSVLTGVLSPARAGVALLVVGALTWALMQWQDHPTQPESIDLALLVDEAPLSAYTRPDFESCLNRSC